MQCSGTDERLETGRLNPESLGFTSNHFRSSGYFGERDSRWRAWSGNGWKQQSLRLLSAWVTFGEIPPHIWSLPFVMQDLTLRPKFHPQHSASMVQWRPKPTLFSPSPPFSISLQNKLNSDLKSQGKDCLIQFTNGSFLLLTYQKRELHSPSRLSWHLRIWTMCYTSGWIPLAIYHSIFHAPVTHIRPSLFLPYPNTISPLFI